MTDTERLDWLEKNPHNNLVIFHNDHHSNYQDADAEIDGNDTYSDDPPEVVQRMRELDSIWRLQVYPDTPIGFYAYNRPTLREAIDAAADAAAQAERGSST